MTQLGDGMLDLDAGVQLEKGEAAVLAEDELGRAGALVAQRSGQRDGGVAHLAAQRCVDGGGGALLEHLLVAALDGAVALAEGDRVAVRVGEELDLDVARTLDVALEEHRVVAEAGERLALRGLDRFVELLRRADDPHAAPASAGRGLDDQREPDLLRRAGLDHGDAGFGRDPLRLELVPGGTDDIRRRTHPGEPGSGDRLGQRGALGEEAVARMHGVRTGARRPRRRSRQGRGRRRSARLGRPRGCAARPRRRARTRPPSPSRGAWPCERRGRRSRRGWRRAGSGRRRARRELTGASTFSPPQATR